MAQCCTIGRIGKDPGDLAYSPLIYEILPMLNESDSSKPEAAPIWFGLSEEAWPLRPVRRSGARGRKTEWAWTGSDASPKFLPWRVHRKSWIIFVLGEPFRESTAP